MDTKWKRPVKYKPDDHDLRQLLSYKLYYQGDTAYLLYPCCGMESHTVEGLYYNKTHQHNSSVFKDEFGLQGGLMLPSLPFNFIKVKFTLISLQDMK